MASPANGSAMTAHALFDQHKVELVQLLTKFNMHLKDEQYSEFLDLALALNNANERFMRSVSQLIAKCPLETKRQIQHMLSQLSTNVSLLKSICQVAAESNQYATKIQDITQTALIIGKRITDIIKAIQALSHQSSPTSTSSPSPVSPTLASPTLSMDNIYRVSVIPHINTNLSAPPTNRTSRAMSRQSFTNESYHILFIELTNGAQQMTTYVGTRQREYYRLTTSSMIGYVNNLLQETEEDEIRGDELVSKMIKNAVKNIKVQVSNLESATNSACAVLPADGDDENLQYEALMLTRSTKELLFVLEAQARASEVRDSASSSSGRTQDNDSNELSVSSPSSETSTPLDLRPSQGRLDRRTESQPLPIGVIERKDFDELDRSIKPCETVDDTAALSNSGSSTSEGIRSIRSVSMSASNRSIAKRPTIRDSVRNIFSNKSRPLTPTFDSAMYYENSASTPLLNSKPSLPETDSRPLSYSNRSSQVDVDLEKAKHVEHLISQLEQEFIMPPEVLFKEEGKSRLVKAGSLRGLVTLLTSHNYADVSFMSSFLMTYRSFTQANTLLKELILRFKIEIPDSLDKEGSDVFQKHIMMPIRTRVFNVLKHWIDKYYYDFSDNETLMRDLEIFLNGIGSQQSPQLAEKLRKRLAKRPMDAQNTRKIDLSRTPPLNKTPIGRGIIIHDVDEMELARQLTLVTFDQYASIQPKDLLDQAWNEYKKDALKRNAVNIITDSFNKLSSWVVTDIVQGPTPKERMNRIVFWVAVSDKLQKLQNYNSLMAINAALNKSPVRRLAKTWEKVPASVQTMFQEMSAMLDSKDNYKMLRIKLKSVQPPCIPFLGMYLTDLTFIEDGNPNTLSPNDLINFDKRRKVSSVISEIQQYQLEMYHFHEWVELFNFVTLQEKGAMNEDEVYSLSLKQEPRQS